MAKLIPARNTRLPYMTSGEKRLSERLEKKLEDDYLLWYDVPIGPKQLRPDFVIVHPLRGVLVLEVKDWKLDTILEGDRFRFVILGDSGPKTVVNPLLQARAYILEIVMALEADPALRALHDSRHGGKLVAPWGHGVVLSNITRAQFNERGLAEVIEPGKVICKDEMLEDADPLAFQERLWGMFTQPFSCKLTLPQLDRIRWHLFPDIRVSSAVNQFGLFDTSTPDKSIKVPDLIKVMDLHQEQLARSMGEGHRVIHGVAGSGKTMILGYRCLKLARELAKPILVLCFNKTLAGRLRQTIESNGITQQVTVRHFHGWCGDMLTAYNVDKPRPGIGAERYAAEQVERTIAGVENGQIPRAQYGAVMIDEGHDFQPEWFKLVVQMVDPASNSMLVLYDDAQTIYRTKETSNKRRAFSFASVGVQAQGRTTILKLNYRNTLEILSVARSFAAELLSEAPGDDDGIPLIAPESAGRRGPVPELIRCTSADAEAGIIAARIKDEIDQGRLPSEIGVVYRKEASIAGLERHLKYKGVPFRVATGKGKETFFEGEPAVKVVSMHSSKGLEFHSVYIPGLGQMPAHGEDEAHEARLLYVAMTRATGSLALTADGSASAFVERVAKAVRNLREIELE